MKLPQDVQLHKEILVKNKICYKLSGLYIAGHLSPVEAYLFMSFLDMKTSPFQDYNQLHLINLITVILEIHDSS